MLPTLQLLNHFLSIIANATTSATSMTKQFNEHKSYPKGILLFMMDTT